MRGNVSAVQLQTVRGGYPERPDPAKVSFLAFAFMTG
jgi:hypothetical protein